MTFRRPKFNRKKRTRKLDHAHGQDKVIMYRQQRRTRSHIVFAIILGVGLLTGLAAGIGAGDLGTGLITGLVTFLPLLGSHLVEKLSSYDRPPKTGSTETVTGEACPPEEE
ncbi:hypothetical protein ACTWPT_52890 [Nonomuraea sp. 3N208]|uniref:hypothetical protein n=1 Tax=Nonomuraea sp. 3N208 TaxID=3457421 RepID=UPI003FD2F8DF